MADNAESHLHVSAVVIEFVAAGVHIDLASIEHEGVGDAQVGIVIGGRFHLPHVGPHSIGIAAGGLAIAGIEHEHLLGHTVAVPVVVVEVDERVYQFAALLDHERCVVVVALSVEGIRLRERDGSHHIELEFELSVALVVVEIVHAAYGTVVIGVTHIVGQGVVAHPSGVSAVLLVIVVEGLVAEVGQDDKSLFMSDVVGMVFLTHAQCPAGAHCLRSLLDGKLLHGLYVLHRVDIVGVELGAQLRLMGQHAGRRHDETLRLRIVVGAVHLHDRYAVACDEIVETLIAQQHQFHACAVGLCHGAPAFLSRHSPRCCHEGEQQRQHANFSHQLSLE